MKKIIYLFLILLCVSTSFAKKKSLLYKDPYTIEDIEKLKVSYQSGKDGAIETLIEISKDKEQILLGELDKYEANCRSCFYK